jgi:hypothetical protein
VPEMARGGAAELSSMALGGGAKHRSNSVFLRSIRVDPARTALHPTEVAAVVFEAPFTCGLGGRNLGGHPILRQLVFSAGPRKFEIGASILTPPPFLEHPNNYY